MASIIRTQVYRTGPIPYIKVAAELWLGHYWWALALPVVASLALGMAVNPAFLFVGLMLAMAFAPTVLMILFYSHVLTPEARIAVLPHYVEIGESSDIVIGFAREEGAARSPGTIVIPRSEIREVEYRGACMIIHLSGRRCRFVVVPYSAFDSPDQQHEFGAILSCRMA